MTALRLMMLTGMCCFAALLGACDSPEPEIAYNCDLGEGDTILLPPAGPIMDARLVSGRAEMPEFREPGQEPDAESQIRAMIDEYNELVEEEAYEDLPDYFVEQQREAIVQVIELQQKVRAKLAEVAKQFEEMNQAAPPSLESIVERFARLTVNVETIAIQSESEASGTLSWETGVGTNTLPILFKLVDGDWMIENPALDQTDLIAQGIDAFLVQMDEAIEMIKSGALTSQVLEEELVAAAARRKGEADAAEAPTGEEPQPAEGEDTEPAEEEEEEPQKPPQPGW